MRVALPYPYTKRLGYHCTPPLAVLYLATALKQHGTEVQVFDLDGYPGGRAEMLDAILRYAPDLIGVPIFTDVILRNELYELLPVLRERLPRAHIVAGGPHATAWPEETLQAHPEVDYVLRGEADETFPRLVREIEAAGDAYGRRMSAGAAAAAPGREGPPLDVPGLCRRADGATICDAVPDPPRNLDALPIPDRSFLGESYRKGVYWRIGRRGHADMVMTSRGCPFDCKFCFKMSHLYRARGPESVVRELTMLAGLGITSIDIEDDLFTANKARCVAICRGIRTAGLRLDLKVRSHVRTIDKELLSELRAAGVSAVVFGIESGSPTILQAMNKKATVADNRRAIRLVKKAGMQCIADMILGFPGETLGTIDETKQFLLETRPTAIHLSVLTPFPETKVYLEAKAAGTLRGDWNIAGTWPYVDLPGLEDRDLLQEKWSELQRAFYSDPRVLASLLAHLAPKMNVRDWRAAGAYMRGRLLRRVRARRARG